MSMIKCPNCGIEVSDSYDYCIQCGFSLKYVKNNNSNIVLAARSRHVGTGIEKFLLIFGSIMLPITTLLAMARFNIFVIVLIILDIFLIVLSINNINEKRRNENNNHECAYYDNNTKKIIIYSISGDRFDLSLESIQSIYKIKGTLNLFVKYIDLGKTIKVNCGCADKSSVDKFNNFVQHLKNGDYHE